MWGGKGKWVSKVTTTVVCGRINVGREGRMGVQGLTKFIGRFSSISHQSSVKKSQRKFTFIYYTWVSVFISGMAIMDMKKSSCMRIIIIKKKYSEYCEWIFTGLLIHIKSTEIGKWCIQSDFS